jgi:hypothetical protein
MTQKVLLANHRAALDTMPVTHQVMSDRSQRGSYALQAHE